MSNLKTHCFVAIWACIGLAYALYVSEHVRRALDPFYCRALDTIPGFKMLVQYLQSSAVRGYLGVIEPSNLPHFQVRPPSFGKDPKILVSMTSSPRRMKDLPYVLRNFFSAPNVTIQINIPQLFRNKDPYDPVDIQRLQSKSNVIVKWYDIDTGPSMKLLPTIASNAVTADFVITLDDDVEYAPTLLSTLRSIDPKEMCIYSGSVKRLGGAIVPFGVNAIVLPKRVFTNKPFFDTLQRYTQLDKCKMHDDLAIGWAAKSCGISIQKIHVDMCFTRQQYSSEGLLFHTNRVKVTEECRDAILGKGS